MLSRKINFSAKVPSKDKVNAILDIENWEKVENIDKNINPIYTLELYYDTTKRIIVYIAPGFIQAYKNKEIITVIIPATPNAILLIAP